MSEALRLADDLIHAFSGQGLCAYAAAELRRLHAENEALKADTKSLATMSNLWAKEKALNAELMEALQQTMGAHEAGVLLSVRGLDKARAALKNCEVNV
jgi:hypothetical protein